MDGVDETVDTRADNGGIALGGDSLGGVVGVENFSCGRFQLDQTV